MKCKYCHRDIPEGTDKCLYCCRYQDEQPPLRKKDNIYYSSISDDEKTERTMTGDSFAGSAERTRPNAAAKESVSSRPAVPTSPEQTRPASNMSPGQYPAPDSRYPYQSVPQVRKNKSNAGWIVAAVLLCLTAVILAVWTFVPEVQEVFGHSDQQEEVETVQAGEAPGYLQSGMPLYSALQLPDVSLSIITSYEVGKPDIHTLYIINGGACYATNVTDEEGGWSFLTDAGKRAMRNALSNAGRIESFNIDCVTNGAEIVSESRLSPQQLQNEQNRKRDQLKSQAANVVKQFVDTRNLNLLDRSAMARYIAASQAGGDQLYGPIRGAKISDGKFECIDVARGLVRYTFRAETEDSFSRMVYQGTINFTLERAHGGELLITSWNGPQLIELSRENKMVTMPDIMEEVNFDELEL